MKIGIISSVYGSPKKSVTAGTGIHSYNISKELTKNGLEVHVFTSSKKRRLRINKLGKGILFIHEVESKVESLEDRRLRNFFKLMNFDKNLVQEIFKENLKGKFDILNTHGFLTNGTFLTKCLLGIRWVHTIHAVDAKRVEKMSIEKNYAELVRFFEGTVRYADNFIAVSKAVKNEFSEYYQISPEKIKVIPNGVDLTLFRPLRVSRENFGYEKDDKIILFVGRFSKEKGIDILLKIIPDVLKKSDDVKFLIISPKTRMYSDSTIKKLERKFEFLEGKFKGRIKRISRSVPQIFLRKLYNFCNVYIQPSLYEAFGLTLLEAMACEVPVIATNVGCVPDIIKNRENGLIIEASNTEKFAEVILEVLNDKNLADKLGKNAQKTVKKFSWVEVAKETVKFYKKIL